MQSVADSFPFPRLLLARAQQQHEAPAIREKDLGILQSWSWREVATEVREFACGLASLGFRAFNKLAIVGANRPHLYTAVVAAQPAPRRGVPVPLYQDPVAGELASMLEDTGVGFVIARDQEAGRQAARMRRDATRDPAHRLRRLGACATTSSPGLSAASACANSAANGTSRIPAPSAERWRRGGGAAASVGDPLYACSQWAIDWAVYPGKCSTDLGFRADQPHDSDLA